MLGGIKEVQEESELTSSLKKTSNLQSSAFDRLRQMMDSGLSGDPELPAKSELSQIDPLQNLLDLEINEPLKYSS